MLLTPLLDRLPLIAMTGEGAGRGVSGVVFDSRKVQKNSLFVAVPGTRVDGHAYIAQAVAAGATAIIGELPFEQTSLARSSEKSAASAPEAASDQVEVLGADAGATGKIQEAMVDNSVVYAQVADSAAALATLADAWHHSPSRSLHLVGVTGTNGKTTVTTLLYDLFTALGYKCGLLSTVEVRIAGETLASTHTTPDALAVNAHLAEMVAAGCQYAFMEVSSHAVAQRRTHALHFTGGVFTNLSHDHLDYHGSFANYLAAKKAFFDELPKSAFALSNADDRNGAVMLQNTKARKRYYSLRRITDYRARLLDNTPQGMELELDGRNFFSRLFGQFNAYNLLAAYGVARELDVDADEALVALSGLHAAAGRLDHVADPAGRITAVVDYAHTPDALENVLKTLREVTPASAGLLCVVGCGGDRDKTKRPLMARLAAKLADRAILTSDNPRNEDPETILTEMEAGLDTPELQAKALRIGDRRSAIRTAVHLAKAKDVVLVAGKGHENYQEIKGERFPFDDKLELREALKQRAHVG